MKLQNPENREHVENVRQKENINRMYYTFFKRNSQKSSGPPSLETIKLDEDDEKLFLKAEKMFYCYYNFLRNQTISDKKKSKITDESEKYIDSDDDLKCDGNFLNDFVAISDPNIKNK